jgi:hypothetical protein
MMGELIRIGDEIQPRLRGFLGNSWFSSAIRGVSLDVDDYWEFTELGEGFSYGFYYGYLTTDILRSSAARLFFQAQSLSSFRHIRMDLRPAWWDKHCRAMGYPEGSEPVIIRVLLKQQEKIDTADLPRSFERYPIVYEVRPPNRAVGTFERLAHLFGTDRDHGRAPSIGRSNPNTAGTLGGILAGEDLRAKYLVTCAHVLGPPGTGVYQPGPFEGKKSELIGSVRHWKIPNSGSTSDPCSEQATPNAARLDLAVAELAAHADSLSTIGSVTIANTIRPIAAIRKNDRVTFTGKTRGRVEAKVGALTLWDQIEFPDGVRCFGRVFQLKSPIHEYVREDLANPGDSGSWVVFQMDGLVVWYGMVISCDGGQAYACFADYILEDCNSCGAFPGGVRLLA